MIRSMFANRQYHNPGIIPWAFMILSILTLVALGGWQIQRLGWKEALLEKIEVGQQLVPLTQLPSNEVSLEDVLYRNVRLTLPLDRDNYFLRAGVHRDYGKGYYVLGSIPLAQNVRMLVNRGFIAGETQAVKDALANEEVTDPTIIEGILRPSYAPRLFSPGNHPDKNIWFSEDVEVMAPFISPGIILVPYAIEATAETPMKGAPATTPKNKQIRFRNDHLGYAVTWFGLALTGLIMFYFFCFKRKEEA